MGLIDLLTKKKKLDFMDYFPLGQYPVPRDNQKNALSILTENYNSVSKNYQNTFELPKGSGKEAIGITYLKAVKDFFDMKTVYYITPTKTLVDQIKGHYPNDVIVVYGRNEEKCLYYTDETVYADESPCAFLQNCPHRVNKETGETLVEGSEPCPYLYNKFLARQGGIVVSTFSFYLFNFLFGFEEMPSALVIDEVHKLVEYFRKSLKYEISDRSLERTITVLSNGIDLDTAELLKKFKDTLGKIIFKLEPRELFKDDDIDALLCILDQVNSNGSLEKIRSSGTLDPVADRKLMKDIENILRNIGRYYKSLYYSLSHRKPSGEMSRPLNYVFGYYEKGDKNDGEDKQVKYRVSIQGYYMVPTVKKLLPEHCLTYSGTIGDPEPLQYVSGIDFPFRTFPSDFPPENARIYLPTDTPSLSFKDRPYSQPKLIIRDIARVCSQLRDHKLRTLVVVASNIELDMFLKEAKKFKYDLNVISYRANGHSPKEAVKRFKDGEGHVLAGTSANFAQGLDLPEGICPVSISLRPDFPDYLHDPQAKFEMARFGGSVWKIWNWNVGLTASQFTGRNIRSKEDKGVAIFISQQYDRFLYGVLPAYQKKSYIGDKKFDICINDIISWLGK